MAARGPDLLHVFCYCLQLSQRCKQALWRVCINRAVGIRPV